ncbi:MAG: lytic transglycosylase domain-containing protein [Oscillospiraceae bacterium]
MAIRTKKLVVLLLLIILIIAALFGIKYTANKLYKSAYPKKYSGSVIKYSAEYNIDEDILYAIIKTESDFKPDVTSNVGARGLTQIMEDTFNWIKTKLKDENTVYDDMYQADDNIRYGAFLIGYLYDEFKSYETAAAAYHAGRTATGKWLKNAEYSSDGITLDTIPIKDTQHYVNKVMKSFQMYKKIYDKN